MQSQNKKENNENLEQKINEKTVRKKKTKQIHGVEQEIERLKNNCRGS